ncbi:MAG: hypothetical protein AB7L71_00015 [Vicinamibacterales bacterium]
MPKFTIKSSHLAGFVAEEIKPNERGWVITKCPLATSDMPQFHVWMRHIGGLFFSKMPVPLPLIHRFLIVLHSDDNADVYINDFSELAQVRVVEGVAAGSPVYLNNVSDINEVTFPDIEIKADDAVIYGARTEWRFSLYFDFERAIDLKKMAEQLGTLKREATFYLERAELDAQLSPRRLVEADAIVITEGKSDLKHLMSAAHSLDLRHNIDFLDDEKGRGADTLYTMCEHYSLLPQPKPMIFVFDRDRDDIVKKLALKDKEDAGYREWGNNVYSLCLPVPPGRSDATHSLSVEFFYADGDLCRANEDGRRLFLSSEFHPNSGRHISENLHTTRLNALKKNRVGIIDADVFNHDSRNIALPKDDFAEAILSDESFKEVDRSAFRLVFDVFDEIIEAASKRSVLQDRNWRPARAGEALRDQPNASQDMAPKAEEQLQTLHAGELSADDLNECISILEEGKAVNIASARAELPIAPVVVLKRVGGEVVGLGAIKRQRPEYAASKALASRYDFDQNMHEIGYVAVRRAFGQRGFSGQIMAALLSAVSVQPFWATTSNKFMERTLAKAGFEQRGDPWNGNSGNTLRLWIRTAATRSPEITSPKRDSPPS